MRVVHDPEWRLGVQSSRRAREPGVTGNSSPAGKTVLRRTVRSPTVDAVWPGPARGSRPASQSPHERDSSGLVGNDVANKRAVREDPGPRAVSHRGRKGRGGGCERGGRYNPSSAHLTAGRPALTTPHGPEAGDDARAETTDTGAEDEGRGPRATARPKAKLCQEGGRFPTLQVLVARN